MTTKALIQYNSMQFDAIERNAVQLLQSFWTLTANSHVLRHPLVQAMSQARTEASQKEAVTPAQLMIK